MAETKYTYSISGDTHDGKILPNLLSTEIEESSISTALSYINTDDDVMDIWFVNELSSGDQTTLTSVVAAHEVDLPLAKTAKITVIRDKTESEEALGVPYNGYRFSVSASTKSNWLAVVMIKDTLSYPFSAPTGFGVIYYFQSADDVSFFFASSMAFLKYWEESNEALIITVNACTTVEQVNAIIDDRIYPPPLSTTTSSTTTTNSTTSITTTEL